MSPDFVTIATESLSLKAIIYMSLWQKADVLFATMSINHGPKVFLSVNLLDFVINAMAKQNSQKSISTQLLWIHAEEDAITLMQVRTRISLLYL